MLIQQQLKHIFPLISTGVLQDYQLSRLLGFSVYLPICPFTALPALWTTAFGFLPSVLATTTVVIYIIW